MDVEMTQILHPLEPAPLQSTERAFPLGECRPVRLSANLLLESVERRFDRAPARTEISLDGDVVFADDLLFFSADAV